MPPFQGGAPKNRHDGILFDEWCYVTPIGYLIGLGAPGEGPCGHEALHHSTILWFVPNGVGMVWASLLKKPLEVICR
jgi:hypothetical protein